MFELNYKDNFTDFFEKVFYVEIDLRIDLLYKKKVVDIKILKKFISKLNGKKVEKIVKDYATLENIAMYIYKEVEQEIFNDRKEEAESFYMNLSVKVYNNDKYFVKFNENNF